MKTFALEAEHIVKRYGSFLAVDNVAIKVRKNNVHSVIGPNGAGKTTLFNALTGTIPLTSGRILVNGNNIENLPVHKRIAFGISRSFQITALFRSEEHTSELQSLMRISYAVFCLKKKNHTKHKIYLQSIK